MISIDDKKKIREYLDEVLKDLNVNSKINMAYFLAAIDETNDNVKALESSMQRIINNQRNLENKIDIILRKINNI